MGINDFSSRMTRGNYDMHRTLHLLLGIFIGATWFFSCWAADWPTFRGNLQRTGFYPDRVGSPARAEAWKDSLGCEIVSSPSVKDSVLYIGARDSCVYAINCNTGNILWKYKTGDWVDCSPLIDQDRLIIGSRDNTIYSLDKKNGTILTQWIAGLQLSSPAITSNGTIISGLGIPNGGVAGYYSEAFQKSRTSAQWSIPISQYTYSSPAIYGQALVIGATDGRLYGIDIGIKDTIWSLPTGGGIYLSTPAIDGDMVFFAPGDDDRNVYSVNLLTGKVIWKSEGTPAQDQSHAALHKTLNTRILPATDRDKLMMLSATDRGKIIGDLRKKGIELPRYAIANNNNAKGLGKKADNGTVTTDFIPLQGIKTSSVAVGAKNVFVIQKELGYVLINDSIIENKQRFTLCAFNKTTGTHLWSFSDLLASAQRGYLSSPVVTMNTVYFGWGEGRMYGLTLDSGTVVWQDSLRGHIISSPAIAMGKLYVATMDGFLYAYNLSQTAPGGDFTKSTYCYPNPARHGVSHIQVYVTTNGTVEIAINNWVDQPVLRIKATVKADEKYTYDWNVRNVANGVYFAYVKVKYENGNVDKKNLKIAVLN